MGCTNRGDFISQASERPQAFTFLGALFATNAVPEKMSTNGRGGGDKKIKTMIERSDFRQFSANFRVLGPPSKNSKCHNYINTGS